MSKPPSAWGKYRRISTTLRKRLTDGMYGSGTQLPSESALCKEFGAVRNTIRRALADLEADGLITRVPSVGWFVVCPSGATDRPAPRYQRIADDLRAQIRDRNLTPGALLPSESDLARTYGVSRFVVRQAFADLQRAGLVIAVHGKGRFVRQDVPR
ncbi:GntR family transcriptional regulator [Spirillospora sp. NPDC047279]|uniref:GntR family transcriptional regulator n=1 Tax=Spirillospora sp. NPDC047279 TaxID=3155478 RepID=UPI0033FACDC7